MYSTLERYLLYLLHCLPSLYNISLHWKQLAPIQKLINELRTKEMTKSWCRCTEFLRQFLKLICKYNMDFTTLGSQSDPEIRKNKTPSQWHEKEWSNCFNSSNPNIWVIQTSSGGLSDTERRCKMSQYECCILGKDTRFAEKWLIYMRGFACLPTYWMMTKKKNC